jgi:hypothetical protein
MTNAENSFESPEIADQYIAKMSVFENARVSAENARADAESARVSAETSRASAEAKRVSAENARVQEMQELSKKVEEALSGAGGSSGGFRKIGFTEDCDYVATEGDGLTAFRSALEAAVDGDTILVMSGVYEGVERFEVTKNVNFIGVGRPEIDFTVWISGGGIIDESYVLIELYPSITSRWKGFDLWGGFEVGCNYDPSGNGGEGCGIIEDCEVSGNLKLTGAATNCYINVDNISTGHYYGSVGTDFKQCFLKVKQYFEMNGGSLRACEIYPSSDKTYEYYTNSIYAAFSGCRIYTLGTTFSAYEPHGGNVNLGDTIVFANSVSGCDGGYLVKPTAN